MQSQSDSDKISPLLQKVLASKSEKSTKVIVSYRTPPTEPNEVEQGILSVPLPSSKPLILYPIASDQEHSIYYGDVTDKQIRTLAEDSNIEAIVPNQRIEMIDPIRKQSKRNSNPLTKEEIDSGKTWGLDLLKISDMWSTANTRGAGVKVGVIDTGVDGKHPTLKNRIAAFRSVDKDANLISGDGKDYEIHGTHICGIIAGNVINMPKTKEITIGVAPEVELYVVGINFSNANLLSFLRAMEWLIKQQVDIINMSFRLSTSDAHSFNLVNKYLDDPNITAVAAIGNSHFGTAGFPGMAPYALSVGALRQDIERNLSIADFSGGGTFRLPHETRSIITPTVVAPGVDVFSASADVDGMGICLDGTSMATPHVTGVAALLKAARNVATRDQIRAAIIGSAFHPHPDNRMDNRWGHGLIQPVAALNYLDRLLTNRFTL